MKYSTTIKFKNSNIEKVGCYIDADNIKNAIKIIENMGGIVLSSSEEFKSLVYTV